jgi:hypothetical protein
MMSQVMTQSILPVSNLELMEFMEEEVMMITPFQNS